MFKQDDANSDLQLLSKNMVAIFAIETTLINQLSWHNNYHNYESKELVWDAYTFQTQTSANEHGKLSPALIKGFPVLCSSLQAVAINAHYNIPAAVFQANRSYIYKVAAL